MTSQCYENDQPFSTEIQTHSAVGSFYSDVNLLVLLPFVVVRQVQGSGEHTNSVLSSLAITTTMDWLLLTSLPESKEKDSSDKLLLSESVMLTSSSEVAWARKQILASVAFFEQVTARQRVMRLPDVCKKEVDRKVKHWSAIFQMCKPTRKGWPCSCPWMIKQ